MLILVIRVLVALLGVSFVVMGGLYTLRYFSLANGGFIEPYNVRKFSLPEMAHATGAFAREWLAVVAVSLIRPLGWTGTSRRVAAGAGDKPPVVLVPGYLMNRSCMTFLASRLLKSGRSAFTLNIPTTRGVEECASRLAYFVEEVVRETGSVQVDIVAYSLGGLVARYYVERLKGHARVRRVVTLGTAHRGTELAVLGIGRSARQMKPGSDLLADLQAAGLHESVDYTSLWSTFDPFVLPPDSAKLPEPARNVVIPDTGHGGLLLSRVFGESVLEALGDHSAQKVPASEQEQAEARV